MSKKYKNNAYNRRVGRAEKPLGTHVISKSKSSSRRSNTRSNATQIENSGFVFEKESGLFGAGNECSSAHSSSPDTFLDNAEYQSLGPLPKGSMSVSNGGNSGKKNTSGITNKPSASSSRTYVDNKLDRSAGRVEQPLGSMSISLKGAGNSIASAKYQTGHVSSDQTEVENAISSSAGMGEEQDENKVLTFSDDILDDYRPDHIEPMPEYQTEDAEHIATMNCMDRLMRQLAETEWFDEHEVEATTTDRLPDVDEIIPFTDLKLCEKIGEGRFSVVHLAELRGTAVAVKEMKSGTLEGKKKDLFTEKIKHIKRFRRFVHPNIVRYIGACNEPDHICIVMEYMKKSLFDVIHIDEDMANMEDDQRLTIIRQICFGLIYLHGENVAHCDLRSDSILMTMSPNGDIIVKISDFGLSLVRKYSETSLSTSRTTVSGIGKLRYAAPEVLRGEALNVCDMMRADIWSLALIVFEIVYEEEPYPGLSTLQLQKQVGEKGCVPEIPKGVVVNRSIEAIMDDAWKYDADDRPEVNQFSDVFLKAEYIFRS